MSHIKGVVRMYRNKKDPSQPEAERENIAVWECESDDCLGWMRKDFSFAEEPACPLCGESMKSGERLLYKI